MTASPTRTSVGSATPAKPSARAWAVTALLVVFMLINFGDKAVLGLAADPMMADLDMSASEYGLISSAFYALFSISAIVVGFVANRRSNKKILLIMALVWSLTQVPVVFFASVVTLAISRTVLGAAEGPANPLAVNAAQKWFPDHRRNLPTSLVNLGAALGVVVMAPLLSFLIDRFGWQSAFATMMVLGVVWAIVWAIVGREGQVADAPTAPTAPTASTETAAAVTAEEIRVPYRRIFLSGTGLSIFVAGFAVYWGLALLVAWIPVYLNRPMELTTATAGTLIVLPWLCGAILIPLQGFVSDRLMQRGVSSRVARVGISAACITIAGIALAGLPYVSGIAATMVLLTVGFAVGTVQLGIGMTLMAEITPTVQRAAALATLTAVTGLSGIIAPALAGRLVDAHGADDPTGYHQVFLLTAALFVVGALCLAFLGRPARDSHRLLDSPPRSP